MNKQALIEALKEGGRVVVLSIIPVLIASLEGTALFNWKAVAVVAAISALKVVDRYMHELEPKGIAGGLVRF